MKKSTETTKVTYFLLNKGLLTEENFLLDVIKWVTTKDSQAIASYLFSLSTY